MKIKFFAQTALYVFFLFSFLLFILSSCTKESDETTEELSDENSETAAGFTESDEDLLSVDYMEFYDELSPHGEWVQVSAEDLGLDLKKKESKDENGSLLDDLFGVKNVYADVDFGMFFVWKPSPDLAVTVTAGEPAAYVPYTNGQWVYTDAGWYFKAPTPYEERTSHYGRWVYDPAMGWVWVPGRVWAPAWVDWRENDGYVAWAPIPPSVYIVKNSVSSVIINENHYTIVEKRFFMEPSVYKYRYQYVENKNKIMIKEMTKVDGVMIKNKTVINKGPDANSIGSITGKKVEMVKIKKVKNKNEVKYAEDEISVYTPEFTVKKEKKNQPVSKPEKFVTYKDAGGKEKNEKTKGYKDEKSVKEKSKGYEKDKIKGKEKDKGSKKLGDDRGMKNKEKLKEYNEKNKSGKDKGKGMDKTKGDNANKDKGNKNKGKK